jgi:hypothetical protein
VSEPLSLYVNTHGTGTVGDDRIEAAIGQIGKLGGLTPRGIRTHLALNKPIYEQTAAYGHFGRKAEGDFFPWERVDLVEDLKAAVAGRILLLVGLIMAALAAVTGLTDFLGEKRIQGSDAVKHMLANVTAGTGNSML